MSVSTIGVIANCEKAQAEAVIKRLATQADKLGLKLAVCDKNVQSFIPHAELHEPTDFAQHIQLLLAMGGDGTMLHAVRTLDGVDVPVIGINLGSLGFMTTVTEENMERSVEGFLNKSCFISKRALANCKVYRNNGTVDEYDALNDVVLGWGESTRIVGLDVSIDDEQVTTYRCDGLILSTPTGSTGHSLSAGGPILHPETDAIVINVICPHALSARPLVIKDSSTISVTISECPKKLLISIDGQEVQPADQGDRLEVSRSSKSVRFVHLPGYSYFSILSQKLHWRGSSV